MWIMLRVSRWRMIESCSWIEKSEMHFYWGWGAIVSRLPIRMISIGCPQRERTGCMRSCQDSLRSNENTSGQ